MIQSGSSAPQPSTTTDPSLCVTPISCTRMMRDEGICHHLHHSTKTEPQPVMGPGPVMSHGQFAEGVWKDLFSLINKNLTFNLSDKKQERSPLLNQHGFFIVCGTTCWLLAVECLLHQCKYSVFLWKGSQGFGERCASETQRVVEMPWLSESYQFSLGRTNEDYSY